MVKKSVQTSKTNKKHIQIKFINETITLCVISLVNVNPVSFNEAFVGWNK